MNEEQQKVLDQYKQVWNNMSFEQQDEAINNLRQNGQDEIADALTGSNIELEEPVGEFKEPSIGEAIYDALAPLPEDKPIGQAIQDAMTMPPKGTKLPFAEEESTTVQEFSVKIPPKPQVIRPKRPLIIQENPELIRNMQATVLRRDR